MKRDIKELGFQELSGVLKGWGMPAFHARQVFAWIYKKGAEDFSKMSDLPHELRRKLEEEFLISSVRLVRKEVSRDGTEKFLLELRDKHLIEAVSIPAEGRVTGCVSTQAGCRFGCVFCASGALGFKRNLSAGEMLDEILLLKRSNANSTLTHLVFMGTGEPLDNYENTLKAIRAVNAEHGLRIGARRITISTCGIVPAIERLAGEGLQIELSVSLHGPDDDTRSRLMPVNRKYPVGPLLAACRDYAKKTKRQVTFEYILIKGVNSDLQKAKALGTILGGLNCKVNLIPANPVGELGIEPPGKLETLLFKDALAKAGVPVTLRKPRGSDIAAACGQLRLGYGNK